MSSLNKFVSYPAGGKEILLTPENAKLLEWLKQERPLGVAASLGAKVTLEEALVTYVSNKNWFRERN